MCAGCRTVRPILELTRIVKRPTKEIVVDSGKKAQGRGAYLCKGSYDCLCKARQKHSLARTLKAQIPEEIYKKIEEEWSVE